MSIDEAGFKKALSHFASGITIVTTEHEGQRFGMTVASFASLSLRPPLVVICIEKGVKTHDAIAASRKFGVSILRREQEAISTIFASKPDDRFEGLAIRAGETGVPLIEGALTTIECRLHDSVRGGDHTMYVGEVLNAVVEEGTPLIYFRSGYHSLA